MILYVGKLPRRGCVCAVRVGVGVGAFAGCHPAKFAAVHPINKYCSGSVLLHAFAAHMLDVMGIATTEGH